VKNKNAASCIFRAFGKEGGGKRIKGKGEKKGRERPKYTKGRGEKKRVYMERVRSSLKSQKEDRSCCLSEKEGWEGGGGERGS